jgi:uncharacterized protein with PQ loop repeat
MAKNWRSRFDQMMVIAGLISPVATIPQIIKLYATHTEHASGQSLTTWAAYTAISVLWVIYGVMKHELPLVIGNGLGAAVYGIMAIGIVIHAGITF